MTVERDMRDTARALALALDGDIQDIKNAFEALAASQHLDGAGNLQRFYDEATAVSKGFGGWAVLSDATPHTSSHLDGVKVLVVEDDADIRDLVASVLAEHGAEPITAANARDGIEALRRRLPDVLVCDIAMPGDDGYTFIATVRSMSGAAHVPAMALTAYARREDRERALAAGFDMHLVKPGEPTILVGAVARLAGGTESTPTT